ncbi:MAG: hypothetical protein IPL83_05635 [Bdellovibrionales bacterium]|nr:hypothetical protein [Bdellovibrionales bacterium]
MNLLFTQLTFSRALVALLVFGAITTSMSQAELLTQASSDAPFTSDKAELVDLDRTRLANRPLSQVRRNRLTKPALIWNLIDRLSAPPDLTTGSDSSELIELTGFLTISSFLFEPLDSNQAALAHFTRVILEALGTTDVVVTDGTSEFMTNVAQEARRQRMKPSTFTKLFQDPDLVDAVYRRFLFEKQHKHRRLEANKSAEVLWRLNPSKEYMRAELARWIYSEFTSLWRFKNLPERLLEKADLQIMTIQEAIIHEFGKFLIEKKGFQTRPLMRYLHEDIRSELLQVPDSLADVKVLTSVVELSRVFGLNSNLEAIQYSRLLKLQETFFAKKDLALSVQFKGLMKELLLAFMGLEASIENLNAVLSLPEHLFLEMGELHFNQKGWILKSLLSKNISLLSRLIEVLGSEPDQKERSQIFYAIESAASSITNSKDLETLRSYDSPDFRAEAFLFAPKLARLKLWPRRDQPQNSLTLDSQEEPNLNGQADRSTDHSADQASARFFLFEEALARAGGPLSLQGQTSSLFETVTEVLYHKPVTTLDYVLLVKAVQLMQKWRQLSTRIEHRLVKLLDSPEPTSQPGVKWSLDYAISLALAEKSKSGLTAHTRARLLDFSTENRRFRFYALQGALMEEDKVQNAVFGLVKDPEYTGSVLSALDRVKISSKPLQRRIEKWIRANPLVIPLMEGAATELLKGNYGIPWYSKRHDNDRDKKVCAKILRLPQL